MRHAMPDDKPNPLDIEAARLRRVYHLPPREPKTEEITPEDCGIDPDQQWKSTLLNRIDKKTGEIEHLCRAYNLITILEHDQTWKGRLRFDEFRQNIVDGDKEWTDTATVELKAWFEQRWIRGEVKTGVVREAVEAVAARSTFHPVRDWLTSLAWDGNERILAFFADFCAVPISPYTCAVAHSLFVSAVARVFKPGCKVDTMVVFEGSQGIGKSKLVQALFGAQWHCDITQEPGTLDFYQCLRGKWIGEFSELSAMGKTDQNRVKQALTQTADTYRPSYGRYSVTYPRQFIFCGNTNKDSYLADETGARRYLPIACRKIDDEGVAAARYQLWAEAVHRFRAGEKWWDIPDAQSEQDLRYQADAWEDYIEPWLADKTRVLISEVLSDALLIKIERQDRSAQIRAGNILRRFGWLPHRAPDGDRRRFYVKKIK